MRLSWWNAALVAAGLAACGQNNTYQAPPPPKVTVAKPVEQKVTRYFEATGNAAAVNSANLVARVQGFLTEVKYTDGMPVKKGQHLFTIEPEPYQLKLQQAQAAETAAQASQKQTEADFERQQELVQRQAASKAAFDAATAKRDTDKAKVLQAQADTKTAQINLDYTKVVAPFDGIVTARQVSVGELVGGSGTQVLATIVQLDPIYVNFNASERDVLHVRDMLYKREPARRPICSAPRSRSGCRPTRAIRTRASSTTSRRPSIRAPARSRRAPNCRTHLRLMLPGFFVRVRVPLQETSAMLVPSVALGSDQGGRYVLIVNGENVVEQRKVEVGPTVGEMAVIESGLKADDRVVTAGILRAVPGQKVDPQTQDRGEASGRR